MIKDLLIRVRIYLLEGRWIIRAGGNGGGCYCDRPWMLGHVEKCPGKNNLYIP